LIGIALAQFFVWGVSSMTGMSYHWQYWPSFFSSLLCMIVSLITGYFPARATTKIHPVHTLRNL
jgi:ABC-type antimicrobial peptide transport system permease subunit